MTITQSAGPYELASLSAQLTTARDAVDTMLWDYRSLVGENDFANDVHRSSISAGQTITALLSSLGQVSRALAEAEDAWNASQTHSRRLNLGAEIAPSPRQRTR